MQLERVSLRKRKAPTLGDELPTSKRRKQKMTFGKKFADKFGEDRTVEISAANIHAAVETFLRSVKKIKDSDDVFAINLDEIVGKKPTDVIKVGVRIRKE